MKKIILFLALGLTLYSCSSNEEDVTNNSVVDLNGLKVYNKSTSSEIADGSVINMSSVSNFNDANALKFYFKNETNTDKKVRIRLISFSGVSNTNQMSFCYGANINSGNCLFGIPVGESYPESGETEIIVPANGTSGTEGTNKIINSAVPEAPATSVNYEFEVYQYNSNGDEVGNKVRFTYRYSL